MLSFIDSYIAQPFTTTITTVFAPWPSMIKPMRSLLNANDSEKDTLTARWLDAKLDELRFVGITGALIGATVTGAFAWDNITNSVPVVRAFWYSSLLLALVSLSIATQQGVTLRRLSSHRDGFLFVRQLLGRSKKQQQGLFEPRLAQLYVWQTSVMLLNFSIILAVVGLAVLIVDKAKKSGWAAADMHVLAIFGMAGVFAAGNYLFSTMFLYSRTLKVLSGD